MTETLETPVIGITVDDEENGAYSKYPWYALRQNYSGAVVKAGGLPMLCPTSRALPRTISAESTGCW